MGQGIEGIYNRYYGSNINSILIKARLNNLLAAGAMGVGILVSEFQD